MDQDEDDEDDDEDPEERRGDPQLILCARSFVEFVARSWIENCAWFALVERHRELSAAERRYLDGCRR